MGTTAFDPELPLWEAVVVEGIEDGKAAVVIKLHHAVADGVGGMALILRLLDRLPVPARGTTAAESSSVAPAHSDEEASAEIDESDVPRQAGLGQFVHASRRMLDAALRGAIDPVKGVRQARGAAESVVRLLAPAREPLSPLMVARSLGRRFEVLDLPSDLLHTASMATGGTLNDVFVTGILGGLRHYHHEHGVEVEQLRVLMPINVRNSSDHAAGNHFVPARFVLSTVEDPAERLGRVHRIAGSWKHAPGLGLSDVLAFGLDLLPPSLTTALWGSMLKGDDFVATNVPGPPFETYFSGAHVERFYAFAPCSGAAVNVALTTTGGCACVGMNLDTAAIPDGAVLARCLEEGFDEVLHLTHSRLQEATT
jgi:WS/DGAT/MGAT family acyltransferase